MLNSSVSSVGPWLAVLFFVLITLFCVSAVLAVSALCLLHSFVWVLYLLCQHSAYYIILCECCTCCASTVLSTLFCVSAVLAVPALCLLHYFVWALYLLCQHCAYYITLCELGCLEQCQFFYFLMHTQTWSVYDRKRIICSSGGRELSRGRVGHSRLCSCGGHSWNEV
jgi:hypothetical protein